MFARTVDRAFGRFRTTGDSRALALVFDRTAPELLALGRHLASGEAAAEDLVQATFLTAIEDQHSHDGARPVLPWLIGILANHAREARRRGRRELDPARLRAEALRDPVTEAEGRELGAELADAIARLPEPYRPVLRLHLLHGLEPAEIAATLERPDGTVRAQLHRGLERLRKLLPAGLASAPAGARAPGRGLQAVRAAVLLRCGAETPAAGAAITVGVIAMLLNKKILSAAAALVLLGGLGYVFANPAPAATHEPVASDAQLQAALQPIERTFGGVRTEAPAEPVPGAPVDVRSRDESSGAIHVRVERGSDHVPVPGIGVAVLPEYDNRNPLILREFVASDEQGGATFAGLAPGRHVVEVDRVGWVAAVTVAAGQVAEQVVQLATGIRVHGSVVDMGGSPVAGAIICLHGSRLGSTALAQSDGAGRFQCEYVIPGVELQARKSGFGPSLAVAVPFASDGSSEMRLELGASGSVITGRVVDETGQPVTDALVAVHRDVSAKGELADHGMPQVRAVFTPVDAAGSFRTDEVAPGATLITVCARGFAPTSTSVTAGTAPVHAEIVLSRGASVEVTVSERGAAVAGASVIAWTLVPDVRMGYLANLVGFRAMETDARGYLLMAGLLPGSIKVIVRLGGAELGQRTLQIGAGETAHWDVSRDNGAPFAVHVEPPGAPGMTGQWFAMLRRLHSAADAGIAMQTTDAQGWAKFASLEQGRYDLTVYCQPVFGDMIVGVRREVAVVGSETRVEVPAERMVLQPVRGRLVDAALAPADGATVTLQARLGNDVVRVQRTTGVDGRFEFAGVPAGRYVMTVKVGEGPARTVGEVPVAGDREEKLGDVHLPR